MSGPSIPTHTYHNSRGGLLTRKPRPLGQGFGFDDKPLACRQGAVHGLTATRLPPLREGSQCAIVAGVLAWSVLSHQSSGFLSDYCPLSTVPTVAGQRRTYRLPPLDPVHPGNGVPRSAVFSCGASITQPPGPVKPQATGETAQRLKDEPPCRGERCRQSRQMAT
jgi:hypothetical protein